MIDNEFGDNIIDETFKEFRYNILTRTRAVVTVNAQVFLSHLWKIDTVEEFIEEALCLYPSNQQLIGSLINAYYTYRHGDIDLMVVKTVIYWLDRVTSGIDYRASVKFLNDVKFEVI